MHNKQNILKIFLQKSDRVMQSNKLYNAKTDILDLYDAECKCTIYQRFEIYDLISQ